MYIFTLPDTLQNGLERKPHLYSPFFLCVRNVPGRLISSDSCLTDSNSTLRRRLKLTATTTNDTLTVDTPTRSPPSHLYLIPSLPLISLLPNSLALTNSATGYFPGAHNTSAYASAVPWGGFTAAEERMTLLTLSSLQYSRVSCSVSS